jgi:hypothetical protein
MSAPVWRTSPSSRGSRRTSSGRPAIALRRSSALPEFSARLTEAIRDGDRVGVMFHHAVMGEDDLARADEVLALVARHDRVRAGTMLDPTQPRRCRPRSLSRAGAASWTSRTRSGSWGRR